MENAQILEDKLSKKEFYIESNMKDIYPPHKTNVELLNGVKQGRLYQGSFRASRDNFLEGFVNVESLEDQVSSDMTVLLCLRCKIKGPSQLIDFNWDDNRWSPEGEPFGTPQVFILLIFCYLSTQIFWQIVFH